MDGYVCMWEGIDRDPLTPKEKLKIENELDDYYRLLKHIDNISVYKNEDIVQLFEERQRVVRKINELKRTLYYGKQRTKSSKKN